MQTWIRSFCYQKKSHAKAQRRKGKSSIILVAIVARFFATDYSFSFIRIPSYPYEN